MSLWMLIRIVAGLVVAAVVVFTLLMVRHVRETPLDGVFSEWVPVDIDARPVVALPEPSTELPEIDPGAKVFDKARQQIAVGDLAGARERLRTVVSIYPRSKAAPEARRILGEMNLDEWLSVAHMGNKSVYEVKRGDSYLGIAAKHDTSLDMIVFLNGLYDLGSLQPGDELVLMPLNLRVLIEPDREAISLWDGGRFLKEYEVRRSVEVGAGAGKTKIASKMGFSGERRFSPATEGYRGASKVILLDKPALRIAPLPEDDADDLGAGLYLDGPDMEELALLTRPGNEVEIRRSPR